MSEIEQLAQKLKLYVLRDADSTFEMFSEPGSGYATYWQEGISHTIRMWSTLLAKSLR